MKIHEKNMKKALVEAQLSLDLGNFPVGCVIATDDEIIARGERKHSQEQFGEKANELDHAEIIAIRNLFKDHPAIDISQVTVYSTMEPCLMCFATLLVNGIRKFVYSYEDAMGGGTNLPLKRLNPLYNNMKISITPYVLRSQSLALFKQFFSSDNKYLQNSLLARYTLKQP